MRDYTVKSLNKALRLLECFTEKEKEFGVTELSLRLDENKSTVFSILKTFESRGYIEQNPANGKYKLGIKLVTLGFMILEGMDLLEIVKPVLKELVNRFSETAYLAIWNENYPILVDKVEGTNSLRMSDPIGRHYPLHCTAIGKLFLSSLSNEQIKKMIEIARLPKYTDNTIITYEDLMIEIERIREKGYAVNQSEEELGVLCIGTPIRNHEGKIIAAISISGAETRLNKERTKEEIISCLLKYSREISNKIGHK